MNTRRPLRSFRPMLDSLEQKLTLDGSLTGYHFSAIGPDPSCGPVMPSTAPAPIPAGTGIWTLAPAAPITTL